MSRRDGGSPYGEPPSWRRHGKDVLPDDERHAGLGLAEIADRVLARVAPDFALRQLAVVEADGVDQRRGTYGATGSGAKYVNDMLFTGGGVLSVVGDGLGMTIIFK